MTTPEEIAIRYMITPEDAEAAWRCFDSTKYTSNSPYRRQLIEYVGILATITAFDPVDIANLFATLINDGLTCQDICTSLDCVGASRKADRLLSASKHWDVPMRSVFRD